MSPLALPRDEAHLWYVDPDAITDAVLLAKYKELMTAEEAARHARFMFERGRLEFLVTRALVRTTLSRYADVAPKDWRFSANAQGRPEIMGPRGVPPLHFNLSNTHGLVVCLVAMDRELGVDVEDIERSGETVEIADRFFSPSEAAELRSRAPHEQRPRFFDYWTLKESYIKARGMGLSLPLELFSFYFESGAPIRIAFDPKLADAPSTWQFDQFRPTTRHLIATALRRGANPPLRIILRPVVPLVTP